MKNTCMKISVKMSKIFIDTLAKIILVTSRGFTQCTITSPKCKETRFRGSNTLEKI